MDDSTQIILMHNKKMHGIFKKIRTMQNFGCCYREITIYKNNHKTNKNGMCNACKNEEDNSKFFNCRCSSESRLEEYFLRYEVEEEREYKQNIFIVFKCCEICGEYLYGGTNLLKCTNESHHNYHQQKMMEEDKKYLYHLLHVEQIYKNFYTRPYNRLNRLNFYYDKYMIIILDFHLKTKYFFVNNLDIFKYILIEFLGDLNNIYLEKTNEMLSYHVPYY